MTICGVCTGVFKGRSASASPSLRFLTEWKFGLFPEFESRRDGASSWPPHPGSEVVVRVVAIPSPVQQAVRVGRSEGDGGGAVAIDGEEAAFLVVELGPRRTLELVDVTAFLADEPSHLRMVDLDILDDGGAQLIQVLVARRLAVGGSSSCPCDLGLL
jgi:hypothetical protein